MEELEEFIWALSVIDDTDLGLGERPSWKSDTEHTRDSSRGARIHSWLVDYLRAHQGDYGKLKDRILSSDSSAIEEFRKLFGPTALARRFAEHDGASGDDWQLASSRTLIKRSPLYKSRIQPLLNGKEPKEEDRERWDTIEDLLDRAGM